MLETVADVFTVVGGIFAIYWAMFLHQLGKIKAPGGADHYLGELDVHRSRGDRYHALLERGLDGLDRFFDRNAVFIGSRPWGRAPITSTGLLACVGISLAYTLSLFLLTWAFGGSTSMGGYELLSGFVPTWKRWLLVMVMIIYIVFFFQFFRKTSRVAGWIKGKIVPRENKNTFINREYDAWRGPVPRQLEEYAELVATVVVGAGVVVVSGAGALALTIAVFFTFSGEIALVPAITLAGAVAVTVAVTGVVTGAGAGAGAGAVAVTIAGVVAFAGAVAGAFAGAEAFFAEAKAYYAEAEAIAASASYVPRRIIGNSPFLIFFGILPWVNGLLDWISWIVTRSLGRRLLKRPGWVALVGHGVADLVAAVVLLAALAFLLAGSMEEFNQWALANSMRPLLNIKELLVDVGSDPFGPKGVWVTSMLVTTLIPTLLHVMVLVYTLTSVSWLSPTLLAGLAERLQPNGEGKLEEPRLDPVAHFFTAWWLVCLLLALLLVGALGGLIYHLLPSLGEWLLWAAQAGVDGARWLF